MKCNLCNSVLAVVFVLAFVHHTYSPWRAEPPKPPSTRHETCVGWILFNGFTENAAVNLDKAMRRFKCFDKYASVWAAIYASSLTVFLQYFPIDPHRFCRHRYMDNTVITGFTSLKESKYTCTKWITLYGFHAQTTEDIWNFVHGRSRLQDTYMSIWPALYARYIHINQDRASTKQEDFCKQMGHNADELLPFVAMFDTFKNCLGWLHFAGYTDDLNNNMTLVLKLNPDFFDVMNYFIVKYSRELLDHIALDITANPVQTRNLMRKPVEIDYRTPEEFCDSLGELGTRIHPYKQ